MISRKRETCNIAVHRASYAKHLRSKNQSENEKQIEMIIPKWLFQEPTENKINEKNNPKSLNQIARDNIKLDDKQLNKGLAEKMINPYYFNDSVLQVRINITLKSHHINHANFKLIPKPNVPEFGIEVRYINKNINELSVIYARLKSQ